MFSTVLVYGQEMGSHDQEDKSQSNKMYTFPIVSIGWTPSALLNRCPGIQASLDFGVVNGKSNISVEYAYIYLDNFVKDNDPDVPDSGFRLKLGYETMLPNRNISIGGGFLMRNTNAGMSVEIVETGFLRKVEYDLERDVKGVYSSVKWHYNINKRLNFRTGLLLGLGAMEVRRRTDIDERPELVDVLNSFILFGAFDVYQKPGNYTYPLMGLHLNISYVLNQ